MKESLIYPGEYIPLPEVERIQQQAKLSHLGFSAKPPINLCESSNDITIQVAIPGIKRENIFIYTQYDILSIIILGKKKKDTDGIEQIHEFDMAYLERRIVLPEEADTDFMYAEYKEGILYLYIPKGKKETDLPGREIVVY